MEDFISDEPESKIREYKVGDREFTLKSSDPYGFWSVHPRKGPVPLDLAGSYTSVDAARTAVNTYLARQNG